MSIEPIRLPEIQYPVIGTYIFKSCFFKYQNRSDLEINELLRSQRGLKNVSLFEKTTTLK